MVSQVLDELGLNLTDELASEWGGGGDALVWGVNRGRGGTLGSLWGGGLYLRAHGDAFLAEYYGMFLGSFLVF